MGNKILCPGCGQEMTALKPFPYVGDTIESVCYITGYHCSCGWTAPTGSGKTTEEAMRDAREKAEKRAVYKPEKGEHSTLCTLFFSGCKCLSCANDSPNCCMYAHPEFDCIVTDCPDYVQEEEGSPNG